MRALQITEPNRLSITDLTLPKPRRGELLVKIHASSINPSDILNASGGFPDTTYPRVPGRDFAGSVVDGPPELIGQEVFGTSGRSLGFTKDGPHAEFCVVSEDAIAEKPANLTFAQAATIGVPFTTASLALRRAQTTSKDVVLVLGATGSVGSATVQLASSLGCRVITASRRDGSDIKLTTDPTLSAVEDLTRSTGGVSVIVDTTGHPATVSAALAILTQGGRLSFISAPRSGSTDFTFDLKTVYRKEQSLVGCNSLSYSPSEMAIELRRMGPLFASGHLHTLDESKLTVINLDAAPDAYASSKSRDGRMMVITF